MMIVNWTGVYPAVTTKFTADGQLDFNAFANNISAQLDAGVHGLVLGGTLGESSVLSPKEKSDLTAFTIKHINGKVPVIINIAEGATADAIEAAKTAARLGADGLMVLPPMRYKPDHRELIEWFKSIAIATDLPIMIYNNPVDYKTEVTLDAFEELATIGTIQAVKESTREVTNVTRLLNRFGDRFKILCGVDTLAMEELLLGAHGWVAGLVCAFPRETVVIYELIKAKRYEEALPIYRWFMPLLELDIHPKLVQYIKRAETHTGMGTEHVRPPRLPLTGSEKDKIDDIIKTALSTRPPLPM